MAGRPKFQAKELASPDGRTVTTVTSPGEEKHLRNQGWKDESEVDTGADAETANAGREGNRRAADSSTTAVAKDGIERKATSNA